MGIGILNLFKRFYLFLDNYIFSRYSERESTASFWYLPSPSSLNNDKDFAEYKNKGNLSPKYFLDYRSKLNFTYFNKENFLS